MQRMFMALALAVIAQLAASSPSLAAVNINTATQEEFVALHKGLGPAKAQAIIDYRKANGPFKSVDDLRHVKGIGAKRLEKLRPELTVGPAGKVAAVRGDAKAGATPNRGEIRPTVDGGKK
ncbi:MAG TPA: ComEA family DNA-binding protein [Casimicrobiaceae bacterium]|nr:ComEA family DNA-binding protein [Casimicrobiaceae bacterium]